ncbi:hypothetical protein L596_010782 [Steinernema carpocapsae]|uniref:Protein Wnt n=1 Tax=Steinernema carpocapsae TaxID=34508 RepID=A0A4U5PJJ8_STECR|nr:hypothetical protein L596_010782 [Steinernema carpocapsae]
MLFIIFLLAISRSLSLVEAFDHLQQHHQQHMVHTPPPDKLSQGCSPELLHLRTYRNFYQLCRSQPALAVSAYEGIREAMEQCREKMRFQPWDCSQPGTILHEPGVLKYGYRESAYLWAMSSAGAAWGVATACAQGWLDECKCSGDETVAGVNGWEWGGCNFGVQYGITTSRKLLTRHGLAKSPLKNLEKHNLKAGRIAVKKTLISSCKCHGVSGSCQQRTCWKKTAHLSEISDHLTEKYKKAKRNCGEQENQKCGFDLSRKQPRHLLLSTQTLNAASSLASNL